MINLNGTQQRHADGHTNRPQASCDLAPCHASRSKRESNPARVVGSGPTRNIGRSRLRAFYLCCPRGGMS